MPNKFIALPASLWKDYALGFLADQCRKLWLDPWSWKIPQAVEQLSLYTTTAEAHVLSRPCAVTGECVHHKKRSHVM